MGGRLVVTALEGAVGGPHVARFGGDAALAAGRRLTGAMAAALPCS